jgi:branched-chain amino acid aminotransferase
MLVFHNDKFINIKNATVSVDNRSFRYGDGFFETIKVINGQIPLWDYHKTRLNKTLKALQFDIPSYFTDSYILQLIQELVKRNQHEKCARVRVTIFRGEGGIYDAINHRPQLLIQSWPLNTQNNLLNENGLVIGLYNDGFKAADKFANLKTNNYLLYAMAALTVKQSHWNDAIIHNHFGRVADATIANCFLVKDGIIKTPPLSEGPVAGTMRAYLLEHLQKNNFSFQEKELAPEEIMNADEVFLSNAIYGIRWVARIEDKQYDNTTSNLIFKKIVEPLWHSTL